MIPFRNHDHDGEVSAERVLDEQAVAVEDVSVDSDISGSKPPDAYHSTATSTLDIEDSPTGPGGRQDKLSDGAASTGGTKRRIGTRWWVLASGSAILLTILTFAAVYLITKRPSTVDQLVILTVPSGAEIKLNSKPYGNSPVKLEQVPIGTYTLEITKEGFEPIIEHINVFESQPLERRLKPISLSENAGLSTEELLKKYQEDARKAFDQRLYGIPWRGSALYYVHSILGLDPSNREALEMRESIRSALLQSAHEAIARGDVAEARQIYDTILDFYPNDEEATARSLRLDGQLLARRGEVRDLVRKAEEQLRKGNLTEPARSSAYYYAKQALAIDRQNTQALAVRSQIRDRLVEESEQSYTRGDTEAAIKQLERITQLFPEEKQSYARLRELSARRDADHARFNDPNLRRVQGLEKYRKEQFADAVPDLEFALTNNRGTPDVIFALARSHMKLGHLEQAAHYFRQVPSSGDDVYRSSIAALGDIANQRGDTAAALDYYKEARRLGGSTMYSAMSLNDKIERIERQQRDKATAPTPLTIHVKHLHGKLRGTCKGTLTVNPTGVRYDGSEHSFSWNLFGVSIKIQNNELRINNSEKFSASPAEADRFRETLGRYQTPSSN